MEEKIKFARDSDLKMTISHSEKKKYKTRFIKKIPISLEKNVGTIKPADDIDDFLDVKEMLSLISPRELQRPHHKATLANLVESKSIDYLIKNQPQVNFHTRSPDASTSRIKKEFIIRKNLNEKRSKNP